MDGPKDVEVKSAVFVLVTTMAIGVATMYTNQLTTTVTPMGRASASLPAPACAAPALSTQHPLRLCQ